MKSLEKTPFVDVSESQQRAFLYKLFWVVRSRKFAVADIYLDIKFPVTLGFCSQVGCFCPRTLTHTHIHIWATIGGIGVFGKLPCVYMLMRKGISALNPGIYCPTLKIFSHFNFLPIFFLISSLF